MALVVIALLAAHHYAVAIGIKCVGNPDGVTDPRQRTGIGQVARTRVQGPPRLVLRSASMTRLPHLAASRESEQS